jgi:O-antigen/teichoic acid export membrane protein
MFLQGLAKKMLVGSLLDAGFVRQLVAYGMSVVGTMGAGLVLVLILVRLLPAEAYGGMVLTKVSLLVIVSLAGLGLSQAAVRWVGFKERPEVVLGTALTGVAMSAVPAAVILIGLVAVFDDYLKLTLNPPLVMTILVLVPSYLLNNELVNWPRALHQAKRHAVLNTTRGLEQLSFVTAGVWWTGSAAGFIYGLAAGETIFAVSLVVAHRGRLSFDSDLLKKMLGYGWPHTTVIASGFLLTYVDRYMLALLTNDTSVVAYYDAAYVLISSALALLVRPFNLFLFPAYTKRYAEEGKEATVDMVNKAQGFFLLTSLVAASFMVLLREPILEWLYPAGYTSGAPIFAAVAYGTLLNGVFMATVAGLYISQQTFMVGVCALIALLTNVACNWLLIPAFGIMGAAFSTALAACVQLVTGHLFSHRILPVKFPLGLLVGGALWLWLVNWLTR